MIEVVNIKDAGLPKEPWEVYIGRANKRKGLKASPLANPFMIGNACRRPESVRRYKLRLNGMVENSTWYLGPDNLGKMIGDLIPIPILRELARLDALRKKHGKLRLFCWCKPKACHGDVIKEYLEEGE